MLTWVTLGLSAVAVWSQTETLPGARRGFTTAPTRALEPRPAGMRGAAYTTWCGRVAPELPGARRPGRRATSSQAPPGAYVWPGPAAAWSSAILTVAGDIDASEKISISS